MVDVLVRSPMRVTCQECLGQLSLDPGYMPPRGLDQNLRRYHHRSDFKQEQCGNAIFVVTSLKDLPGEVKRLAFHQIEPQD